MKNTFIRILKITLAVIILLSIEILVVWQMAGRFLVVDQQPEKTDVIIVLSGELKPRMDLACELYAKGYAPYLLVSGSATETVPGAKQMKDYAIKKGIPSEAIITEEFSESTYDNALYTHEIMGQHGLKSGIIISSECHMRRTKILFDRTYNGSGIHLIYCASESPDFDPQKWWISKKSTVLTFNEYAKLIGNSLGYYGKENKEMLYDLDYHLFKVRNI